MAPQESGSSSQFGDSEQSSASGRRHFGIDGAPQRSIGDVASFNDKDAPHFAATICNALLASVCTHLLFAQQSESSLLRYGAAPVVAGAVAYMTWECEELNVAFFGGLLIAVSRVLRTIYMSSDYEQLVWRLFSTWLASGAGLFLLLMVAVSTSFRQKLRKHSRKQQPSQLKKRA